MQAQNFLWGNIPQVKAPSQRNHHEFLTRLPVKLFIALLVFGMGVYTRAQTYSNSIPITFNHARVPNTDQTNFPALISGTYPSLLSHHSQRGKCHQRERLRHHFHFRCSGRVCPAFRAREI